MDNEKDIVEFEDLFKEERKKRLARNIEPERRNFYVSSILVYFITMFVISGLIYFFIYSMPEFKQTYSESEALIETLIFDPKGLILLEEEISYDEDYIRMIGFYQSYQVFINQSNTAYAFLMDDEGLLMPSVLESVLNLQISTWSDGDAIVFYRGATQTFDFDVMIPLSEDQIISSYTTLSSFGLNIVNFSTYLVLMPWIYFILKTDLMIDFRKFKLLKVQAVTFIITGYLLVILGNLISNALSAGLSMVFDYEIREAVNQLSIIRALNSRGMPLMLISAIILGPIAEELVFRKAFFGLISNVKVAMVVSSFTFGAVHLIGEASLLDALINGLSYIVMGFVFGYIYIHNQKNIWIPIFVHILSNLIAILALLYLPI
jgi:uncharacterized protein